jgi:hypothetical protein
VETRTLGSEARTTVAVEDFLGRDGRLLAAISLREEDLPGESMKIHHRRPIAQRGGPQALGSAFDGGQGRHVPPVDHDEQVTATAVRPSTAPREVHTIHPGLPIIIHDEGVEIVTCQSGRHKGSERANIFVMIPSQEVMGKVPNLDFRGRQEFVGVSWSREVFGHLPSLAPDVSPHIRRQLMDPQRIGSERRRKEAPRFHLGGPQE